MGLIVPLFIMDAVLYKHSVFLTRTLHLIRALCTYVVMMHYGVHFAHPSQLQQLSICMAGSITDILKRVSVYFHPITATWKCVRQLIATGLIMSADRTCLNSQ